MVEWAGVCALALLFALGVDHVFGEPPTWAHPVVAIGRCLGTIGPRLLRLRPVLAFIGGALAWLLGASTVGALAWAAQQALHTLPWPLAALGLGLLLKPLFAWRLLHDEVAAVEAALADSLHAGRAQLQRLVSRDVVALDATQVRESAIESLAENLNDSLVAPLFWFALGGLPAAAIYRFANTADAMWGYRGHYEWAGKWAARADDVLSWLPARLTALLLCPPLSREAWRCWGRLRTEARRTPSPNGGWPMGAMALHLGVRLGKPGVYALNVEAPAPQPPDMAKALQGATRAAWWAGALGLLATALLTPIKLSA